MSFIQLPVAVKSYDSLWARSCNNVTSKEQKLFKPSIFHEQLNLIMHQVFGIFVLSFLSTTA